MKRYWKVKDVNNIPTGETYVSVFKLSNEQDCTLCNQMKTAISGDYLTKKQIALCKTNLQKHLLSGKHWKYVSKYYIKPRNVNF